MHLRAELDRVTRGKSHPYASQQYTCPTPCPPSPWGVGSHPTCTGATHPPLNSPIIPCVYQGQSGTASNCTCILSLMNGCLLPIPCHNKLTQKSMGWPTPFLGAVRHGHTRRWTERCSWWCARQRGKQHQEQEEREDCAPRGLASTPGVALSRYGSGTSNHVPMCCEVYDICGLRVGKTPLYGWVRWCCVLERCQEVPSRCGNMHAGSTRARCKYNRQVPELVCTAPRVHGVC